MSGDLPSALLPGSLRPASGPVIRSSRLGNKLPAVVWEQPAGERTYWKAQNLVSLSGALRRAGPRDHVCTSARRPRCC